MSAPHPTAPEGAARPRVDIVEVHPSATDPVEHARFNAWARVFDRSQWHDLGRSDAWPADELRTLQRTTTHKRVHLAALDPVGEVVAAAVVILALRDNLHLAVLSQAVLPEHRRQGIGSALLAVAEQVAREHGRTSIVVETDWSGEDAQSGDSSGEFAKRHGYAPTQTMFVSAYDLSNAPAIEVPVPQGYAIETHLGTPPEADAKDRAHLARRMSTDAPFGDSDWGEEDWDADRVRELDARIAAIDRGRVHAFARHLESRRLVGFTEIQLPAEAQHLGYQQDTLVLREHRGHKLGLALKAAAAAALRDAYPRVRSVRTWNAVENTHMLSINRAMGYAPIGFSREWQKRM